METNVEHRAKDSLPAEIPVNAPHTSSDSNVSARFTYHGSKGGLWKRLDEQRILALQGHSFRLIPVPIFF